MIFFNFVFVKKTQHPLKGIWNSAKQHLADGAPFTLLLFPEGTLVSRLTRPKSAAFAETSGVVSQLHRQDSRKH
jgi:1-acyl-sn-glycerol-3-phosphate acyltransferase